MAAALEARQEAAQTSASPVSKREVLGVATILLLFFAGAIHSAYVRPFWFDELSTLFMVSTPTLREMFRAIPTDGNPPLYFLLARLSLHLPIKTEVALRLPAILGYLVASFTVYRFVRRDVGRAFAVFSISLFMGCAFRFYAIEARAYSLLLAFIGVTLVCWQSYCHDGRRSALAGLALCIGGGIFTHQYGALYATLPIVTGEAVRSWRRRTIDPQVLLAVAIADCAVLFTYPVMLRAQKPLLAAIRACPVFFAHPKLTDLKYYAYALPPFVLGAVVLTLLGLLLKVALTKQRAEHTRADVPLEDIAAAGALSLLLPIMLLATHFGTNFFQFRYGIGSSLGVAMLLGLLLARLTWRQAGVAAWTGALYSLSIALIGIWVAADAASTHSWLDPILQSGDAREPIVVASALEYSPMWWYAGTLRGRLHYLADLPYAGQHSDLVPEYSLALEHQYTPMQMENYPAFLSTHQHFLLYCYGETRLEWIKTRLLQEGWHLTLLASAKQKLHVDMNSDYRELYAVSR